MSKFLTLKNAIIIGVVTISICIIWLFVAVLSPEKEEIATSNTPENNHRIDIEGLDFTPREIPLFDKPANNRNKEVENNNE